MRRGRRAEDMLDAANIGLVEPNANVYFVCGLPRNHAAVPNEMCGGLGDAPVPKRQPRQSYITDHNAPA